MRFPPSFLDDIRARIPIADVVGRRVTWDKRKSNPGRGDFWACCPFHGENTPSFHAENRKGRYFCFGCGVSGDHFRFLVEAEGLTFPQAVEQLAAEAGIPLPERDPAAEKREAERATLHDVMEKAARFFQAALQGSDGAKARAYLRERGISGEMQARFRLGYAPASRNALKAHLAEADIPVDQMIEAGLLVSGEDIPVAYDRFRDRLIFPIDDFRGRVIAFGGRALSPDAQPKYLNSPETPLFRKSQVLYNGQAARAASRKGSRGFPTSPSGKRDGEHSVSGGHVVAVEGYIDVIACVAAGFEATVAPLGTSLTDDQLRLLWQMDDEPVLCFDGDAAGLKAAFRAVELALPSLAPGKSVRFALLPEGQDPDDFVRREGPEPFRKLIEAARPLIDMLWHSSAHGLDLSTPEQRAALEQRVREAVNAIADPTVRRHYETAVRERIEQHFRSPRRSRQPFRAFAGGRAAPRRDNEERPTPSSSLLASPLVREGGRTGGALADAVLVGVLVLHPEIAAERLESLAGLRLAGPVSALAAALAFRLAEEPQISAAALRAALEATGHGKALETILGQLARSGLAALADASAERAAAIWDDAFHLRLRTGALSIERQAAAMAFARESGESELIRLRDIQEQEQRNLRPGGSDGPKETLIVHPFKR